MRKLLSILLCFAVTAAFGCSVEPAGNAGSPEKLAPEEPPSKTKTRTPTAGKKVKLANNLFFEKLPGDKRRVLIEGKICLREGPLEQFLCRKDTKEHESIVAADVDAKLIHAALLAAGAKPGSPVQFVPKFKPPTGDVIKVYVRFKDKTGKTVEVAAQEWIRKGKEKKPFPYDWVFAGSKEFPQGPGRPPLYGANPDGRLICISNFETALLDVPVKSSEANDLLLYEAWTDRIPPLGTPVTIILEPQRQRIGDKK